MGMYDNEMPVEIKTKGDYGIFNETRGKVPLFPPKKDKIIDIEYGNIRFSIIPFIIESKKHQDIILGNAKIGEYSLYFNYKRHNGMGVGKNRTNYADPSIYGLPNPTTDYQRLIYEESKANGRPKDLEERGKKCYSQSRTVYWIKVHTGKYAGHIFALDEFFNDGGQKIPFATKLRNAVQEYRVDNSLKFLEYAGKDAKVIISANLSEGLVGKDGKFVQIDTVTIKPAKPNEVVTDDDLNKVFDLGTVIKIKTADEINRILYGAEEDEEIEEEVAKEETPIEDMKPIKVEATPIPKDVGIKVSEEKELDCPEGLRFGIDHLVDPVACKKCPDNFLACRNLYKELKRK